MKKNLLILLGVVSGLAFGGADAAVTIKKAASVSAQQTSSGMADDAAGLAGTVLGLVQNVKVLSAQDKELTDACIPTSREISFVNDMMKEWAKVGEMTGAEAWNNLGHRKCENSTFQARVTMSAGTDEMNSLCYDAFTDNGVWKGYPKASVATYCSDGSLSCKNKKTISNIYEIFNLIDFSDQDYTTTEFTQAANLMNKVETCSSARLSAKKREMWGEFLTTTVSGVGQKTNTGAIMETVGGLTNGGGMSSLGSLVSQFSDR